MRVSIPPDGSSHSPANSGKNGTSAEQTPAVIKNVFQPLRLAKLAIVVGAVALFPFVFDRLPHLASRSEYKLPAKAIRIIPAPERPVPRDFLDQVCRQADLPRELPLLDDRLVTDLARAFESHPWVERVIKVKKSFPAEVVVELEYRRPIAMLEVPKGKFPLDNAGVLLPPADFTPADVGRFPLIRGVVLDQPVRVGQRRREQTVQAAVQLAAELAEKWSDLQLVAIIPSIRSEKGMDLNQISLEVQTKGGSKVLWGRSPLSTHPGELTAVQKLGRIEKYLSEFGDFSSPSGPYEIDIRHWQEITRRPLSTDQAAVPNKPLGRSARR